MKASFMPLIHFLKLRSAGLEPVTLGSEVRCSIQLSYGRMQYNTNGKKGIKKGWKTGLEPATTRSTIWRSTN